MLTLTARQKLLAVISFVSVVLLLAAHPLQAQCTTAVAPLSVTYGVAVNELTNKIYATGAPGINNAVTVFDGATNSTTTVSDPNAVQPCAVAVNTVTNKIYVANYGSANVTVLDGATNSTTTVGMGSDPIAVAVNPVTNKIYVANCGSSCGGNGNVTVIDGATNSTTSVSSGGGPRLWP